MPDTYVPKHRNAPRRRVRKGAKNAVYASGVALFATGLTVSAGVASKGPNPDDATLVNLSAGGERELSRAVLADREQDASRSTGDRRKADDSLKSAELSTDTGVAVTKSEDLTKADPRQLAKVLMPKYGFATSEFSCLDSIWSGESKWNVHANNPYSSAYGIPQALPGSKMASAGPDWQNNAETQIRWGLGYIKNRYGSPCAAWSFKQSRGWY